MTTTHRSASPKSKTEKGVGGEGTKEEAKKADEKGKKKINGKGFQENG